MSQMQQYNDGSGYATEVITITGGNADATIPVSELHKKVDVICYTFKS